MTWNWHDVWPQILSLWISLLTKHVDHKTFISHLCSVSKCYWLLLNWLDTHCSSLFSRYMKLHEVIQMLTFQGGVTMKTLHNWLNTQPDNVSYLFVYILAHKYYFTHICIPFTLSLLNCIQHNDELWCFELTWFLYLKSEDKNNIGLYQLHDLHLGLGARRLRTQTWFIQP